MKSTSYQTYSKDQFSKGLTYSLAAHVFIILFFTMKTVFFPKADLSYQPAVRVDIVDLPDKIETSPAPTPTPAPEPIKPEPQFAEPEIRPEPKVDTKAKQKEALNKLKAMEALEKIKNESKKAKKEDKKKTAEIKYKGNVLSPGTELTGLNKLQHEEYIGALDRHIKQHWTLPEWLAKKNYSAQVLIKIDDKGHLMSKQLVKSSGNPSYDESVQQTIDQSSPFPPPPEKFTSIVSVQGILIGFPE